MTTNETINTVKDATKAVKEVAGDDAVQTTVIRMLDALQNGAVEVGHTVVKYTPDVVDAALWITRIDGIQQVLSFIFLSALSIPFILAGKKIKKLPSYDINGYWGVPSIFYAVAGLLLLSALNVILNVWIWIEIFEPKLYIAKQIVDKVLN